jgi:hypothetical protein
MATQSFLRQLSVVNATLAADIDLGFLSEGSNRYYLPFTFNNFTSPSIVVSTTSVTSQSKLTATTAAGFDGIRVGDVVSGLSGSGAFTAPATIDRTCFCPKGLNYVVYPDTFTSSTLGLYAGDPITSATNNVIASNTVIDKIDYATRRIFLSANVGSAGNVIDVLTVAPRVRVTAVRLSTATLNPNEVDLNTTVSTGGTALNATFVNGAREAVHSVLRFEPISNTTGARVQYTVSVATPDGLGVKGSPEGLNGLDVATLAYTPVGTYTFDADTFMINARLPRPTSA